MQKGYQISMLINPCLIQNFLETTKNKYNQITITTPKPQSQATDRTSTLL